MRLKLIKKVKKKNNERSRIKEKTLKERRRNYFIGKLEFDYERI